METKGRGFHSGAKQLETSKTSCFQVYFRRLLAEITVLLCSNVFLWIKFKSNFHTEKFILSITVYFIWFTFLFSLPLYVVLIFLHGHVFLIHSLLFTKHIAC